MHQFPTNTILWTREINGVNVGPRLHSARGTYVPSIQGSLQEVGAKIQWL